MENTISSKKALEVKKKTWKSHIEKQGFGSGGQYEAYGLVSIWMQKPISIQLD